MIFIHDVLYNFAMQKTLRPKSAEIIPLKKISSVSKKLFPEWLKLKVRLFEKHT